MNPGKVYVTVADYLIRVLSENKRLFCFLLVLNVTYFVNLYMAIDFRDVSAGDIKTFVAFAVYLLFEIFVTLAILRLLPKIFTWLVVALTVIFFCVDAFTLTMYHSVFDKGMFQVLLDTNFQETAEYIGDYSSLLSTKILYAVPFIIFLTLSIKAGVAIVDLLLRCNVRFLRAVSIFSVIILTIIFVFAGQKIFLVKNPLSIIRVSCLIPRAFKEISEYQKVYKNLDSVKIEITRNESDLPWVIFILGESTNRNHMGIYGYDKQTTPHLQRRLDRNDLILFTDCISGATETMPVCQRLFTFFDNRCVGGGYRINLGINIQICLIF